ncbi:MAG TPA: DUF2062 domain-containing protein [Bryobacteraceae bacterium]
MRASALKFRAFIRDSSPEQVALLLSVGLVLGVFPIVGCPTVLCLLAAFALRLNVAALQVLNNVSSPAQLALLLPLVRAGAWLCGGRVQSGASPVARLGAAAVQAVAGWALFCVPAGVVLYFILLFAMRRIGRCVVPQPAH